MSLGYGIGDIMAISGLALKVYTAYQDAPGDYRNISDEVKSLHIIINKAARHFESTTLSDSNRQEGQEVLKGCHNVLGDLDCLIEKYNSLASASTSQIIQRVKLGAEDIATLRARLTSNTTLLNGFIQRFKIPTIINLVYYANIQSCDSDKIQARLDSVLGLQRTMSRDSIVSFAGSINTKKAYKKFCKGLFNIGVTADMISQKEREIQDIFKPQHTVASNQMDDSTLDSNQFPEVGSSSDPNQLPAVRNSSNPTQLPQAGNSSDADTSPTMSAENPSSRSRFRWTRPPIDFLVGPLMLSAAHAGNTKRLVSTLEYMRNINYTDNNNLTALHMAIIEGHEDIVQLLLAKGALIEATDRSKWTPLHWAAARGHMGIVELLLGKGASTEAMEEENWTPLHFAAGNGHAGVVGVLLGKGVPTEARSEDNLTPLHLAAGNGHTGAVGVLLENGASIEALNEENWTPLHLAAKNGHAGVVEVLLGKGALVDAMEEDNWTPLHLAAQNDHADVAEVLLGSGASVEALNESNQTPLQVAAQNHHTDVVKLLDSKATKATKAVVHGNCA